MVSSVYSNIMIKVDADTQDASKNIDKLKNSIETLSIDENSDMSKFVNNIDIEPLKEYSSELNKLIELQDKFYNNNKLGNVDISNYEELNNLIEFEKKRNDLERGMNNAINGRILDYVKYGRVLDPFNQDDSFDFSDRMKKLLSGIKNDSSEIIEGIKNNILEILSILNNKPTINNESIKEYNSELNKALESSKELAGTIYSKIDNRTTQFSTIISDKAHESSYNVKEKLLIIKEDIDRLLDEIKQKYSNTKDDIEGLFDGIIQESTNTKEELNKVSDSTKNSSIDVEGLVNILGDLAKGGKINESTFERLASVLGAVGPELAVVGAGASVIIASFKILSNNTKELIEGFNKIGYTIGQYAVDGIKWFVDSLSEMSNKIDESINKLKELADTGIGIQNSYIGLGNFLGTDALKGLDKYANLLESLKGIDATGVIEDMSKLGSAITELNAEKDQIEDISTSLYEFALNLHGFNPNTSVSDAIESLSRALLSGKIYTRTGGSLVSILGKDGVEAFNKLSNSVERYNFLIQYSSKIQGAYSEYLKTASGKIEILNQQLQSFMGNIGQIALHLYAQIAPVLTQLLQLANGVLNTIMKIFNINVRNTTGVSGENGLSKVKNELEDINKSAEKANKQIASFDDVIQISDKNGLSEVGNADEILKLNDLVDILKNKSDELYDRWEKFNRLLEEGDWSGAGFEFLKQIGDILNDIKWDDIKNKAGNAGRAVAEFINGLTNTDLDGVLAWKTIGTTIAEVFNVVISTIEGFVNNLNFKNIGISLGNAWNSLWANLDIEGAAESFYEVFTGVFEFAIGWLQGGGLSRVATSISEFISSFFSKFTETDLDNIVDAVEGIVDDIINALYIITNALSSDQVKEVVFALITKLVNSFKDNASEWGEKINEIVINILGFIEEAINTADVAGIKEAFTSFIYNLDLGEIISKYLRIKYLLWTEKFSLKITTFTTTIAGFIWDAIKKIIKLVGAFGLLLKTCSDTIYNSLWESLSWIDEDVKSILSGIWDFICKIMWPQNWSEIAKDAINALWDGIKSVWNSTIGKWSIDIPGVETIGWEGIHISMPKLATGGIVTKSTFANIGEAGAEAVLPLENNTGWMDKLATKIANQVGNGNNSGTIRVELKDKPFYTRAEMYELGSLVVDSLKAYGLNIAIV